MHACMHEWMNEWIAWHGMAWNGMEWSGMERMNEWMDEWMKWMNEMSEWMNERMNGWMNEWMNGWINEWKNEWMTCMHKCMHAWINECVDVRFTPSLVPVVHRSISKDFNVCRCRGPTVRTGRPWVGHGTCGSTASFGEIGKQSIAFADLVRCLAGLCLGWLGFYILLDHLG